MIPPDTNYWYVLELGSTTSLQAQIEVYPDGNVNSDYGVLTLTTADLVDGSCYIESGFTGDSPIGNVCSAKLVFSTYYIGDSARWFAIGQACVVKIRLARFDHPVTSSWVNRGTYYISDIKDIGDGCVTITAYDALYRYGFEAVSASDDVGVLLTGTYATETILNLLSDILLNSRWQNDSRINAMTKISFPKTMFGKKNSPTKRDLLRYTAILAGSNIALDYTGKAYMVEAGNGYTASESKIAMLDTPWLEIIQTKNRVPVTAVNLAVGNNLYKANTGFAIDAELPSEMKESGVAAAWLDIAKRIAVNMNKVVQAEIGTVEVDAMFSSPLVELGDVVSYKVDDGYVNARVQNYRISLGGDSSGRHSSGIAQEAVTCNNTADSDSWVNYATSQSYQRISILGAHLISFDRIDLSKSTYKPSGTGIRVVKLTNQTKSGTMIVKDKSGNQVSVTMTVMVRAGDGSVATYRKAMSDTTADVFYVEDVIAYVNVDLSNYSEIVRWNGTSIFDPYGVSVLP